MAIEHRLTDMDTLENLALTYLGDATRWKEIADYNKLSYPYIVKSYEDLKYCFGRGFLTVVRANFQNAATIRKGWKFQTPENSIIGGITKAFEVTEDVVIPAGQAKGYVPIRCTVPGSFGNILPYTIIRVEARTNEISNIQFVEIYNEKALTGGAGIDILVTGEYIYIPTSSTEVVPEDVRKMLELIGGEDLILDVEGNVVFDPSGDLASVSGVENIRHAVNNRLMTELGELSLHTDYGAELDDIIGSPNISNREKLMEIAILRALSQEDRITDPKINSLVTEGTSVYLDISYKVAVSNTTDRFTTTI